MTSARQLQWIAGIMQSWMGISRSWHARGSQNYQHCWLFLGPIHAASPVVTPHMQLRLAGRLHNTAAIIYHQGMTVQSLLTHLPDVLCCAVQAMLGAMESITIDPAVAKSWCRLGDAYRDMGRWDGKHLYSCCSHPLLATRSLMHRKQQHKSHGCSCLFALGLC